MVKGTRDSRGEHDEVVVFQTSNYGFDVTLKATYVGEEPRRDMNYSRFGGQRRLTAIGTG